ncbi:hypothetical protein O181_103990 [Austropuccinia psidii MF-1]|uniref:Uncharacterized protein n=1 Tax=Austropuccinia psidii MF-1 TaxID=1389203 RepID=A0A9Q3PK95_9BASI|nr:hypothetical protein [Austropuccinia psidii MF-1]
MAKKTALGPELAKNHKLTINRSMATGKHQRPKISSKQGFPSSSGQDFHFNALHTQGPGVVHIWYNIPLCTIFAQKSNGETFRTQLCDLKSSPKSITNFEEGPFSYSVWKFPGGYQKTIQGPQIPSPAEVGLSFCHQDYSKGNSQSLSIFSIIFKASNPQHSLDNSIGPYR